MSPRTPHTPVGPPQQQVPVQGSATRPIPSRPPRAPTSRTRGAAVARSLDLDVVVGRRAYPAAAVCMEDQRGAAAGCATMCATLSAQHPNPHASARLAPKQPNFVNCDCTCSPFNSFRTAVSLRKPCTLFALCPPGRAGSQDSTGLCGAQSGAHEPQWRAARRPRRRRRAAGHLPADRQPAEAVRAQPERRGGRGRWRAGGRQPLDLRRPHRVGCGSCPSCVPVNVYSLYNGR